MDNQKGSGQQSGRKSSKDDRCNDVNNNDNNVCRESLSSIEDSVEEESSICNESMSENRENEESSLTSQINEAQLVTFDSEEPSVPSHKTPHTRSNPAIDIQEHMANIDEPACISALGNIVSLSKRFSTERCEHYKDSMDNVKTLIKYFAKMVKEYMPAHAYQAIHGDEEGEVKEPEVMLVRGILMAGEENFEDAIKIFKKALTQCKNNDLRTRELRISLLQHIGISLCLMTEFTEAERYYQFSLEEYGRDDNLLANNLAKYSDLTSCGPTFAENSPLENRLSQLMINLKGKESQTGEATCIKEDDDKADEPVNELGASSDETDEDRKVCEQDPIQNMQWFPETKDELLDYSAACIQMMIMGAEMVKHQQKMKQRAMSSYLKSYNFTV